jgi:excisionase family DNA binding protein
MEELSNLLTAEELSEILNISEFTVKKLARSRQLPCVYVNRRPRFNLDTLLKFFRQMEGGVA